MLPASSSSCPTVGANCRGGRTADAKGWLKRGGGSRALVGSRGEVGMSGRGTPDIPRFGALRRDNTPSPAECSWMIDSTMLLLELYGGGRKLAKAWAAPSLRCCCFVASPMLTCFSLVCVFCLPSRSHAPYDRGLPGGFIVQPPGGTMVMLQVGGSVLSVSGDPGWVPLRACGSPGSPRCGPRMPRGTVRRLVDRQGVAESSRVQCSPSGCRLLSSAVRAGAL